MMEDENIKQRSLLGLSNRPLTNVQERRSNWCLSFHVRVCEHFKTLLVFLFIRIIVYGKKWKFYSFHILAPNKIIVQILKIRSSIPKNKRLRKRIVCTAFPKKYSSQSFAINKNQNKNRKRKPFWQGCHAWRIYARTIYGEDHGGPRCRSQRLVASKIARINIRARHCHSVNFPRCWLYRVGTENGAR